MPSTDAEHHSSDETDTIATIHVRAQSKIGPHQRFAENVTEQLSRPITIYLFVAVLVLWIGGNELTSHPWDRPPFPWVQTALTIYAALVTTIVLITQNRQAKHTEQRDYLDLQVNLLAERKLAKLIGLMEELRRDLPNVRDRHDAQAERMAKGVDAHQVVSALEEILEEPNAGSSSDPKVKY